MVCSSSRRGHHPIVCVVSPIETWGKPGLVRCVSESWEQGSGYHQLSVAQRDCEASPDCVGVQHADCDLPDTYYYYYRYYNQGEYFLCNKVDSEPDSDAGTSKCVSTPPSCPNRGCKAQRKCPPGMFTHQAGTVTTNAKCKLCEGFGYFKADVSAHSYETESCTDLGKIECLPGKYIFAPPSKKVSPTCESCYPGYYTSTTMTWSRGEDRFSYDSYKCLAHDLCPAGKYTAEMGTTTDNPTCKPCQSGFFKDRMSSASLETDECMVANKIECPPGKYVTETGSAQPTCEAPSSINGTISTTKSSIAPITRMTTKVCLNCGIIKKNGKLSCCARGGAWYDKCGNPGEANFDHTWDEGILVCQCKFTQGIYVTCSL